MAATTATTTTAATTTTMTTVSPTKTGNDETTPEPHKQQPIVDPAMESDESASKLTVATAPLTPTDVYSSNLLKNRNNDQEGVPLSSSTLSSKDDDDDDDDHQHGNHHNHNDNMEDDYPIPHACSSPYLSEAFMFSSEWLHGGTGTGTGIPSGELTLPDMMMMKDATAAAGADNDETESVASGGYFEPVDLDSSHWTKAMNIDGPTFGFAMVALATALVHPVLFVAGALTAFGTMQAVGAGYEYYSSSSSSSSDDAASSLSDRCLDRYVLGICHKELPDNTKKDNMNADPKDRAQPEEQNDGVVSNSLVIAQPPKTSPATALAALAQTTPIETEDIPKDQLPQSNSKDQEEAQPQHKAEPQTSAAVPEKEKQPITLELLQTTYPELENTVVKDVAFPGLNAIEFFHVFFADDAPYNFKALQEKRGDTDIVYGNWEELDPAQRRMSLHHDKETQPSIPLQQCRFKSFQGRVLNFKAKTNNFIGPVYACTRKTQHFLSCHKTLVVLESRTDLSEIPFCDKFYVLERWVISAEKVNGKYTSTLNATSQVVFTKSCQFASQIKSKSASTIQDLVKCWCIMAKEALKLTEQSKKLRLQQEEDYEEDDSDYEEYDAAQCHDDDDEEQQENVPPVDEEGVEVTYPEENHHSPGVHIQEETPTPKPSKSLLRRSRILKHCDSAPLPPDHRDRPRPLQGFRRSVSHLWGKR